MGIAEFAIKNKVVTLTLTIVAIGAGLQAFDNLSRLEDPEFTIKEALVVTLYPGATPEEVEEEVTDKLELAVQQLGQLKRIKESRSERGKSTITVEIKDKYDKQTLPQVWDELRRKVNDVQHELPPGASPSMVIDDFGDVWGVFGVVYGDEYDYAELREFAKSLRKEFTLVKDVAKVELFGEVREVIYVEPNRDRMAQLGIPPEQIGRELVSKNLVVDAGRAEFGRDLIAIHPTGGVEAIEQLESILITDDESGRQIYLRDVATVRRGYEEPAQKLIRYDGKLAVGLGISTVSGGNVVVMGDALEERVRELAEFMPAGIDIGLVSVQSKAVTESISGFVSSLLQAVVIVVVVLLFFMGLRSGLLIGFVLFLTICATFIFMGPWEVALERISLGALIIALGMLVDNAIVIVDGMLVRLGKGQDSLEAANEVVGGSALPLLGATIVAVLAFASIGTSQDSTGEFCRSLFQVVSLSLMLSWVTAVTVTPLLCVMFLPRSQVGGGEEERDAYGGAFYAGYKAVLRFCIRMRYGTIGVVIVLFVVSLMGFGYVDQSFFPDSTRPQFMIDFWLPQGTRIEATEERVAEAEQVIRQFDEVTHVTSIVGGGAMRFLVTYSAEKDNSAYAQFLVDVEDYRMVAELIPRMEAALSAEFDDALVNGKKFLLGPGDGGKIQIRITGTQRAELRRLASEIEGLARNDPNTKGIRIDWRAPVMTLQPRIAAEQANLNGITLPEFADAIRLGFEGNRVGVYRERDELLPIIVRSPGAEREEISSIGHLNIWSHSAKTFIPIRQVIEKFESVFEDEIIMRRDRKRTITIHADPIEGPPSVVLGRLMPKVAALELPPGYFIEYGGEYESSTDAQAGLAATIPVFLLCMVLVVIMLFNAIRQPLIIWLTVPLSLIGVTWGLLATGQPFGFMALLGFMSLSGMLIKNAIVLIDEIDTQIGTGLDPSIAVVEAAVSRLRPVAMAALTTVLGMIPLVTDAFFVAMAVTIMAGLSFATLLTMILVPVLYATFFRIPTDPQSSGPAPTST